MDPKAIIAALPMLRRAWKFLPPPLRVPVLLIGAAIGIFSFVTGRKVGNDDAASSADAATPPALPKG